jgi:hypothetical protein
VRSIVLSAADVCVAELSVLAGTLDSGGPEAASCSRAGDCALDDDEAGRWTNSIGAVCSAAVGGGTCRRGIGVWMTADRFAGGTAPESGGCDAMGDWEPADGWTGEGGCDAAAGPEAGAGVVEVVPVGCAAGG